MAVPTVRNWNVWAITIARTFLATTLLLSASVGVSHLTFHGAIAFGFELFSGMAIAGGWLMRYAAAFVLLGTTAGRVLAPHFHLALLPTNSGTTVAVLIASGILMCFGRSTDKTNIAPIDENNESYSERLRGSSPGPWHEGLEVAIRLEDGRLRSRWKRRCIVTIHDRVGGVLNTDQECWYAPDEHRRC
ncbi:MAG TPA: hypothetical protein VHQ22_23495 [Terriglobales bacterium]|jgi:hypothetical protein|nr:hypothetical protein [Terriglobales bacterium]